MRRSLRLAICAAAMLAAAVGACFLLQDDEAEIYVGRHEVAGRIGGLTAHQANAVHSVPSVPVKVEAPAATADKTDKAAKARALDSAKVQVLALAKAAAEKREVPASTAEVPAPRPEALEPAPEKSVPAKPAPEAVKAPSPAPVLAPAAEAPKAEVKPEAKKPEEKQAEKKPAFRKFDDAAITVDAKAEAKAAKVAALKAEAKKAPPKKAVPQLSPVESALADVRAGRLAPVKGSKAEGQKSTGYDRDVTSAKFSMQGSLIKLTLKGNAPMVGHYYVLQSPDRVVLDLAGNWNIELPKVPSNRLIASVRVGQHDDKTRLVFDMKTTGKVALVPLNRNALELRIR